jgi:hypothetical protein
MHAACAYTQVCSYHCYKADARAHSTTIQAAVPTLAVTVVVEVVVPPPTYVAAVVQQQC